MHDFPYWMINDYPSSNEGLDAVMYTSKGWCLDMSRHPLCDLLFWWYMGQLMSAIVIHMVRWRHDPSEACIYRTWCHYDVTIFRSLCPGMSRFLYDIMERWRHDPSEAVIYRTWCHYDVTIFHSLWVQSGMSRFLYDIMIQWFFKKLDDLAHFECLYQTFICQNINNIILLQIVALLIYIVKCQ